MKPEDIQIGRKYTNKSYPGCIWIGAGKRTPFSNNYENKILVLTESIDTKVGSIFKSVDDEYGADQEDWDDFSLI